jgi:hypothetical protein
MQIDMISIVRAHLCLTCEILFILFYSVGYDLMCTSVTECAHEGYDTLRKRGNSRRYCTERYTREHLSHFASVIDMTNGIACYKGDISPDVITSLFISLFILCGIFLSSTFLVVSYIVIHRFFSGMKK